MPPVEIRLGQRTDPSPIHVPGTHVGSHLIDVDAHPYGEDLYSSEPAYVLRHPPQAADLYSRYGDATVGTPYHSDQAFADIRDVAKYNRGFLGNGWVNEKGEVLAEGVYDACFTQAAGQPGALIREEAIRLRREVEGKQPPPDPLYSDLHSYFALRRRQLPWLTSPSTLPPEFSATPELRLKVVVWYAYQLRKGIDAGKLDPNKPSPGFLSGRVTGAVGTDVMLDMGSFLAIYSAFEEMA